VDEESSPSSIIIGMILSLGALCSEEVSAGGVEAEGMVEEEGVVRGREGEGAML